MPPESTQRTELIDALLRADSYPHEAKSPKLLETHISWILLTGEYAYKIKKPVKLDFLDFSTLDRRLAACEAELRINRRLAPDLYLEVVPIGESGKEPRVGAEPAIEYAVRMHQLEQSERLDHRLPSLESPGEELARFAATLAEFHASEPALGTGTVNAREELERMRANLKELQPMLAGTALEAAFADAAHWIESRLDALALVYAQRIEDGHYRDCHGDLHLENLFWDRGRVLAFDALEFDTKLRQTDTMDEIAFLFMDLAARDHEPVAWRFLTAYLEATGDYDGLSVFRSYCIHRALVRAKVAAIAQPESVDESPAALYTQQAAAFAAEHRPLLVITRGLSGSGKTHLSTRLLGPLQTVRVRSDLERKRLHGIEEQADSQSPPGEGIYDERSSDLTYERLAEAAAMALKHGYNCIADAAFLSAARRSQFWQLAQREDARFAILDCRASTDVLRERIGQRRQSGADASEANQNILDLQLQHAQALSEEELDCACSVETEAEPDIGAIVTALSGAVTARGKRRG